ncbi:DUF2628 domain-containing protein [bacterium]|nr:DUF2628 domain-containing protein [bacterium]
MSSNFFYSLFLGFIWFFRKRMYLEGVILFIISVTITILIISVRMSVFLGCSHDFEIFVWLPLFFLPNFIFAFFADTRLKKKSKQLAENPSKKRSELLNIGIIVFSVILYFILMVLFIPWTWYMSRQVNPLIGRTFVSICEGEISTRIIFLDNKKAEFVFHEFWSEDGDNGGEVTRKATVDYQKKGEIVHVERMGINYVFSYSYPKKELRLIQLVGDGDEFFSAEECLKTMVDEKDQ